MQISKPSKLKHYVKAFIEFDDYINEKNADRGDKFKPDYGYLINLEIIEEIKQKINYQTNKYYYQNLNTDPIDGAQKMEFRIQDIQFKNSDYLLNMLFNGNKYIIINQKLWKMLCKEGKENTNPFIYEFNYRKIKFQLIDKKELIFNNQYKNIITKDIFYSYYNPEYFTYKSNYEVIIKNIYDKIIE